MKREFGFIVHVADKARTRAATAFNRFTPQIYCQTTTDPQNGRTLKSELQLLSTVILQALMWGINSPRNKKANVHNMSATGIALVKASGAEF